MPSIKYPQYPNTVGWVSDDEEFEEEVKKMFPLSLAASLGGDQQTASGNTKRRHPPIVVKKEESTEKKTKKVTKRKGAYEFDNPYDYNDAVQEAKEEAKRAGLIELPISEVRKVDNEDGKVMGVYRLNKQAAEKHFFAYDGFNILACVPDVHMIDTVLHDLACLSIMRIEPGNPEGVEFQKDYFRMRGIPDGAGWAVHIYPKSRNAHAKKSRKS
ncbi:hypothetical protein PG984_007067 [Apiospora sp. TS-2023a]